MARTTVNVDDRLLGEASKALGTKGVTRTINAAMADVTRRAELATFSIREFDITDDELAGARRDRTTGDG